MTVSRSTTSGRVYLDLRNVAKQQRRPISELLNLYALEGFLDRLGQSEYVEGLVLKDGVLLAAFGTRRATRDTWSEFKCRSPNCERGPIEAVPFNWPVDSGGGAFLVEGVKLEM
jgi:hypothetical protein